MAGMFSMEQDQRSLNYNHFYDPKYTQESDPEGFRRATERITEQMRELCTGYGDLLQIGFDGGWPKMGSPEAAKFIKGTISLTLTLLRLMAWENNLAGFFRVEVDPL